MDDKKICLSTHIGKAHVYNNIPCQDRVISRKRGNVTCIALSDGCGSEMISQYGAEMAVDEICEIFLSYFDMLYATDSADIKRLIFDRINKRYAKAMNEHRHEIMKHVGEKRWSNKYDEYKNFSNKEEIYACLDLSWFSSTIQFVATSGAKAIVGRLGDGFIGYVKDGVIDLLSYEKKSPEMETNQTFYLYTIAQDMVNNDGKSAYWSQFDLQKINDADKYSMFFISSDGLDIMLDSDMDDKILGVQPWCVDRFVRMLDGEIKIDDFLTELFESDSVTDDLSLIVMGDKGIKTNAVRRYHYSGNNIASITTNKIIMDEDGDSIVGDEILKNNIYGRGNNSIQTDGKVNRDHASIETKTKDNRVRPEQSNATTNYLKTSDVECLVNMLRKYNTDVNFEKKFVLYISEATKDMKRSAKEIMLIVNNRDNAQIDNRDLKQIVTYLKKFGKKEL